jgi:hypothetical protein
MTSLEEILTLVIHEGEPLKYLNTLEFTRLLSFLQHSRFLGKCWDSVLTEAMIHG